jgi:hypothetical protein
LGYDPELLDATQAETRQMTLGEKRIEVEALREKPGAPVGNKSAAKSHCANGIIEMDRPKRGSNAASYLVARLKRDTPAIAADLAAGKYHSVRAAAKAAGSIQNPTPLMILHRYWRQVNPENRLRFLVP